jgi:transcriptional regulator with XRE-family HTH domain
MAVTKKKEVKSTPAEDRKYHRRQATIRFIEAQEEVCHAGNIENFADVIGMSANNISRLKNSNNNFVTIDAICNLCLKYGYSFSWVMAGIGPKKGNEEIKGLLKNADQGIKQISILAKEISQAVEKYKKATTQRGKGK